MKRCPKCQKDLELDAFGTRKMGEKVVPQSWCRGCRTKKVVAPPAPPAAPVTAKAPAAKEPRRHKTHQPRPRLEISLSDVAYFAAACYQKHLVERDWAITPPPAISSSNT